ncbi:AAA family ATPase [Agrobacterium pusense]|uniref:AAA family ATPase n=1 Tax=Agrobacterium pusense TaxID=648995 RepID=UPI00244AFEF8|nr:AAA family ATPase [Agrobacterium pusense]MDH0869796.1 AAA family ATPase [Agrobacterium pusense]
MARRSDKRFRCPWKLSKPNDEPYVTLPVFLAYCTIAAVLRSRNRKNSKFIAILRIQDDCYLPIYSQAAEVFLMGLWEERDYNPCISAWDEKRHRDQIVALNKDQAIFFAGPDRELDTEAWLLADVVVSVAPPTRRQAEAALRRFGIPVSERDVEILLSETWSRLHQAFQTRRQPASAMERLRQYPRASLIAVNEEPEGPSLDEMHGFGPLLKWGHDLAIDLADYKAGRIQWEEVDAGVLISGPPGSGKTLFAGALAKTCGVPLIYGSVSAWQMAGSLDDHLKAMRASFDEAKAKAPAILFVDEVDTFGDRSATDRNRGYMRAAIAGFLELLDGFNRRKGVIVISACNNPEQLDPAIRRPGRLGQHFEVTLPDENARRSILKYHSGIDLDPNQAEQFTLATEGYSGADIGQLVRFAKRSARRRREDFAGAHIVGELPPTPELPADYLRSVAVHEAGHAIVAVELGFGELVSLNIASYAIPGNGNQVGGAIYTMPRHMRRTRAAYLDDIAVTLGGIAAETVVFEAFFDGAAGSHTADLNTVTRVATLLEAGLGMGHTLMVADNAPSRLDALRANDPGLRKRVHDVIANEFERAKDIIRNRRAALDEIATRLVQAKSLSGDDVRGIIERYRRPTVSLAKLPRSMGK